MNHYQTNVIVVGAGIAGLTSAIGLIADGIDVIVLEKRARSASAGTAVVLWPNGVKILQSLGMSDGLATIGSPLLNVEVRSIEGGSLGVTDIMAFSTDAKAPVYVIDRNHLKELLLSKLPQHSIHFSCSVEQVNSTPDNVKVISSVGDEFSAEILVGADGINSAIRSQYFNKTPPSRLGVYDWMGITAAIPEVSQQGTGLEFLGRGIRAGFMPLKDSHVYFRFTCALNSPPPKTQSYVSFLKQIFSGGDKTIQWYLQQIQDSDITFVEESDIDPLSDWVNGRVCLVGDAAHAMTPALGQGANQSIEDAYVLSKTLAAPDTSASELLRDFCFFRKERANDILIRSREKTKLFTHSRSTLLDEWYDDMKNLSSKNAMKSLFDLVANGPLR